MKSPPSPDEILAQPRPRAQTRHSGPEQLLHTCSGRLRFRLIHTCSPTGNSGQNQGDEIGRTNCLTSVAMLASLCGQKLPVSYTRILSARMTLQLSKSPVIDNGEMLTMLRPARSQISVDLKLAAALLSKD